MINRVLEDHALLKFVFVLGAGGELGFHCVQGNGGEYAAAPQRAAGGFAVLRVLLPVRAADALHELAPAVHDLVRFALDAPGGQLFIPVGIQHVQQRGYGLGVLAVFRNGPFLPGCCFSKRMRKLFIKNEKSVLRFCNKSSKTKRAFTKVLMPCKRPF